MIVDLNREDERKDSDREDRVEGQIVGVPRVYFGQRIVIASHEADDLGSGGCPRISNIEYVGS